MAINRSRILSLLFYWGSNWLLTVLDPKFLKKVGIADWFEKGGWHSNVFNFYYFSSISGGALRPLFLDTLID